MFFLEGCMEASPVACKSYREVKAVLWIRMRMCKDLLDPDPSSTSKKLRKTLISPFLRLLFDFSSLKADVSVKSKKRIRKSEVRIRGSGSVPKCHGFTTLSKRINLLVILKLFIKFVSVTRWSSVLAVLDIFVLHSVVPISKPANLYRRCNISGSTTRKIICHP